ncbi:MAG: hypothetical protein ACREN3_12760 [Gemmatimonadaceae bacterium]
MRTRIALGAAIILAALTIIVTAVVPASGAPSARHSLRRDESHVNAHARAQRDHGLSSVESALFEARIFRMREILTSWRSAHPIARPAPPPVVEAATAPPPDTSDMSTTTPAWACIRLHESSDRFNSPTAPGGAYGFLENTWLSLGYGGLPYQAPYAVQSAAALFLHDELGWQPWSTRVVCGL